MRQFPPAIGSKVPVDSPGVKMVLAHPAAVARPLRAAGALSHARLQALEGEPAHGRVVERELLHRLHHKSEKGSIMWAS